MISADDVNDNLKVLLNNKVIGNLACSFYNENSYYQEFFLNNLKSSDIILFTINNTGCSDGPDGRGKKGAWLKNLKIKIQYKKSDQE